LSTSLAVFGRASEQLGLPLRDDRAVLESAAACGGVPAQFTRDGRRGTSQPTRDLPHPRSLDAQQRDLFAFFERQVPAGDRNNHERRHAATLAEPSGPNRARRADSDRRILARQSLGNLMPEQPLHVSSQ